MEASGAEGWREEERQKDGGEGEKTGSDIML